MSQQHLGPYINFQGRAREAMEFYHKVLGGKLDLQAVNAQGVARPAGAGDRIGQSRLEADGVLIIASDGHPNYPAKVGENMAIALISTDKDRVTKVFNDLAAGGQIKGPAGQAALGRRGGLAHGQIRHFLDGQYRQRVAPERQLIVAQGFHRVEPHVGRRLLAGPQQGDSLPRTPRRAPRSNGGFADRLSWRPVDHARPAVKAKEPDKPLQRVRVAIDLDPPAGQGRRRRE